MCQLPNEILLKLFRSYLNPYDLLTSCIRVNRQWKDLIEDQIIWKIVNPINWARGFLFFHLPISMLKSFLSRSMEFKYSNRRKKND